MQQGPTQAFQQNAVALLSPVGHIGSCSRVAARSSCVLLRALGRGDVLSVGPVGVSRGCAA